MKQLLKYYEPRLYRMTLCECVDSCIVTAIVVTFYIYLHQKVGLNAENCIKSRKTPKINKKSVIIIEIILEVLLEPLHRRDHI